MAGIDDSKNDISMVSDSESEKHSLPRLTKKEKEVLLRAIEGRTSTEIADLLICSKRTVDFHLYKCYAKLNVSNKMQALHKATELGLIRFKRKSPHP